MRYKSLGRTGLKVSELCFGTMSFGHEASPEQAAEMFGECRDRGINFFDCADAYTKGEAERILGTLIKDCRDELVITSKCFNKMADDVNGGGGNRRHILRAVENSLERLGTDRLDILFMHRFDPVVPLEETLRALEKLVSDGKVLYLGASNYAAWQVATALGIQDRHGWARFDILQPMYSLVKRQVEVEILPLARAEGLGVMTYSPVGGGLLSGKYARGAEATGRIKTKPEYTKRYSEEWVLDVAADFADFANARGVHPVSLAVAWAAANPDVTCPIIGGRNLEQLTPSLDALEIDMTDALWAEIAALTRTPPPATDRLEETIA